MNAEERAKKMHRRAQKAEGAIASVYDRLADWESLFENRQRPGRPYVMLVVKDVREALERAKRP